MLRFSLRRPKPLTLLKQNNSSISGSNLRSSQIGERHIAVIRALGNVFLKSERIGVAMTRSPIQLGMRTTIFCGSNLSKDFIYFLFVNNKPFESKTYPDKIFRRFLGQVPF